MKKTRAVSLLLALALCLGLLTACGGEKTDDTRGEATLPTLVAPEGGGNPVVDPWEADSQPVPSLAPNEGKTENNGTAHGEQNPGESQPDETGTLPSFEPAPSLPSSGQPDSNRPAPSEPTPSQPTPSQPTPSQPSPSQPTPSRPSGYDSEEDLPGHEYPDSDEDLKP